MRNYKIEIRETLKRVVEIEAESKAEAMEQVKKKYYEEDIVLDSGDMYSRDFEETTGISYWNEHSIKDVYADTQIVNIENKSGIIVVDVESTGLTPGKDEVLQLSVIDGDGNTLINEYIQPYYSKQWPDAQRVHGISPADVEDAPFAHEVFQKLKSAIASAHTYIGYNSTFDINMLSEWGADFSALKVVDVMKDFAEIYGEYNDYYGTFKWQKLSTCAAYYGYEFKAHDALEDVRATLYCYKEMQKNKADETPDFNNEQPQMQPMKRKKM